MSSSGNKERDALELPPDSIEDISEERDRRLCDTEDWDTELVPCANCIDAQPGKPCYRFKIVSLQNGGCWMECGRCHKLKEAFCGKCERCKKSPEGGDDGRSTTV